MTWEQRFGALAGLDGDEWDVAYERLELEWRAAYTAAFVEIAVARGWRREDAGTWPVGIGDDICPDYRAVCIGCEQEARDASKTRDRRQASTRRGKTMGARRGPPGMGTSSFLRPHTPSPSSILPKILLYTYRDIRIA